MNKSDQVAHIAYHCDVSVHKARQMINTMRDMMIGELVETGKFQFFNFGKFTTSVQKPRYMYNLHTGEKYLRPAATATLFKASVRLKAELNR